MLGDVLADEVQKVADDLGESAACAEHDVTDLESWQEILRLAVSRFGNPNVLVNNAGVLGSGAVSQIEVAEFRRTVDVNLLGPWRSGATRTH